MEIFSHSYSNLANKELDWLISDTEVNYNVNKKYNLEKLKKYGWDDPGNFFTYKFNEHGFRSESFDTTKEKIMFLGCSYTAGVGISVCDRWPKLVADQLNLYELNLGIGGSSSDTAFRLAWYWIPKLNPKIVVCLPPPGQRFEFFSEPSKEIINLNSVYVHEQTNLNKDISDSYKSFVLTRQNIFFKQLKNLMAIDYICSSNNIKLVIPNIRNFSRVDDNLIDLGRDLMHPGIKSNLLFSQTVLNDIDSSEQLERHFYPIDLWHQHPAKSWLNEF